MNTRSIILIVAALIVAGATALLARTWLKTDQPSQPVAEAKASQSIQVLVAALDLPAGRIIQKEDLSWQSWPENAMSEHYIKKSSGSEANDLIGAVVRSGIRASQPIINKSVVKKGERGFMAAVLTPGMRAVSIRVSATSGVSGFVFPGDRVDLILTQSFDGNDSKSSKVSETVLTNVRILAADQKIDDQQNTASIAKNVTIEVTPAQAEQIAVISDLGELRLSLRSLGDPAIETANSEDLEVVIPGTGETVTWDRQVSKVLNRRPGGVGGAEVKVSRGDKVEKVSFGGGK